MLQMYRLSYESSKYPSLNPSIYYSHPSPKIQPLLTRYPVPDNNAAKGKAHIERKCKSNF